MFRHQIFVRTGLQITLGVLSVIHCLCRTTFFIKFRMSKSQLLSVIDSNYWFRVEAIEGGCRSKGESHGSL